MARLHTRIDMLDLPSLLAPLPGESPSGSDLEYDPAFLELERAGAGKAEQQYGDTVIAAEPPDWRAVREHALSLAARTRDLRVAMWLARCGARLEGLAGAVAGLQLIHGLLFTRWADVHPKLDADDGNDPTMRLNVLAALIAPASMLADLRSATLGTSRGSLRVRDLELGLGLAEATGDEAVPSEAGVLEGIRAAAALDASLADTLRAGQEAVEGIVQVLDENVAPGVGPDLQPLVKLFKSMNGARRRALGEDLQVAAPVEGAQDATPVVTAPATGAIATRDDVLRTLDKLCEWLERNEPSNPAPLLLRRAQRLMSKSFIDIVRDLAPDGLTQIERLAGVDSSSR